MSQRSLARGGAASESITRSVLSGDSAEELLTAIYRAVGESLDMDPDTDHIPIQDAVDPEALVRLFNEDSGEAYVSFPVSDRCVTVHSDGEVFVHQFDG